MGYADESILDVGYIYVDLDFDVEKDEESVSEPEICDEPEVKVS